MCRSREFCADTAAAKQFDNFPCAQANRRNHELKKSDVLTKNISHILNKFMWNRRRRFEFWRRLRRHFSKFCSAAAVTPPPSSLDTFQNSSTFWRKLTWRTVILQFNFFFFKMVEYYEVLEVPKTASSDEIKKA